MSHLKLKSNLIKSKNYNVNSIIVKIRKSKNKKEKLQL